MHLGSRGVLAGALAAVLWSGADALPVSAQEFGQWSWEALVGLGARNRQTYREGEGDSRFDERTLALALGMNGFIVHPAVSRFRLGADLQFINTDTGQHLDTDRTGLQGEVELFPRGDHRGSLFFNRQIYDYRGAASENPYVLLSAPDTLTTYGARFRAARGFLGGSLLGIDRSRLDFTGRQTNPQDFDREFYDWSRKTADFSHHVRIEHRYRDLGTVDINYDESRINLDEVGSFTPDWHWTMSGSGLRQDSRSLGMKELRVDDYQLRTRLIHDVRERDLLELSYEFGLTEPDTWATTESHGASVSYQWRPDETWHVGPIASYARVDSDLESLRSPRAGVVFGGNWAWPEWDSGFVIRSTYGRLEREVSGVTQSENQSDGSFIGTVGHGRLEGLRKDFEVELDRNRLRITQAGPIQPPGLGLPEPGLGTEDVRRARIKIAHQWDSRFLSAWGDWNHRTTRTLAPGEEVLTETLTATVQYGARRFDIKANVADSDLEAATLERQSIRSLGVGASLRVWRSLSLRASYRADDRRIELAPDIAGSQVEAGLRWDFGLFYLDAAILESTQRLEDGPETAFRSVTWSLSRRFGGWLPIVSGPERRGVIE